MCPKIRHFFVVGPLTPGSRYFQVLPKSLIFQRAHSLVLFWITKSSLLFTLVADKDHLGILFCFSMTEAQAPPPENLIRSDGSEAWPGHWSVAHVILLWSPNQVQMVFKPGCYQKHLIFFICGWLGPSLTESDWSFGGWGKEVVFCQCSPGTARVEPPCCLRCLQSVLVGCAWRRHPS